MYLPILYNETNELKQFVEETFIAKLILYKLYKALNHSLENLQTLNFTLKSNKTIVVD